MDPESRAKTAFSTPFAHLEFTRMPFGLKNAPATFQRLMDHVLSGLQGIELFVYMDDIVIYGKSLEDHSNKLRALLGRLKEAGLTLQPEKCHFLKKQIAYLGHVISEDGLKPDSGKIEAVKNFPIPKRRKNIKQFLGLVGYYRRFIPEFAKIAKPLNLLLKGGVPFKWTEIQQSAFEKLRDIICSVHLLQYPDFSKPFVVTTDASNYALGAILSQGEVGQDLPIAYASRTLNDAEIKYFTTEKELLAIVFAVQHFRPYLYGRKFILVTDLLGCVTIWLHNLKDPNSRLGRWKMKLSEYEYEIVYKPGKSNANADALSRNPYDKENKDRETSKSPTSDDRVVISADSRTSIMRMESTRVFDDEDLNIEKIENLIEHVFLSRGILDTVEKNTSSDDEPDSENYDIAPEVEEEHFPQTRRTKVTSPRAPLRDNRDPVSAHCPITKNGALAGGERYSNPGDFNDDPNEQGQVFQGPQVRYAKMAPSPSQTSSGKRGESIGNTRVTSETTAEGGVPDSRDDMLLERESGFSEIPVLIVVESCLKFSKDKLLMGKGHIVNFISRDCNLDSQVNKDLIKANMINIDDIKGQNLQVGETVVFAHNGRYIFNVVVKEKNIDRSYLNNISRGIMSLKEAMIPLKVECMKFSKIGNGLYDLSWFAIEQIIQQHFGGNGLRAFICSGEIIFPEKSEQEKLIREAHESTVGGHKGVSKTYWRIRKDYFWNNLKNDVQKYVKYCRKCQENKLVRIKNRQPMQITDTPAQPFERVQMDIIGPLPVSPRGNKYILTIQDNFSKYADAIPIPKIDTATVATALAEQFISWYGCPRIIHTDQGTNFTSNLMKTFCKIFKIDQITSTAFHPQSLGSLERSHQTLVEYLRQYGDKQSWDEWLRFAIFSYNVTVHESTGFAPYTLVFGKEANIPTTFAREKPPVTYIQYLNDLFRKLHSIHSEAGERINSAKEKSKKYYDQKANPDNFNVGDHIYLLNEPRKTKFDQYYTGPYILEDLIGDVTALIRLGPTKTKIVHINKLKLAALPFNP